MKAFDRVVVGDYPKWVIFEGLIMDQYYIVSMNPNLTAICSIIMMDGYLLATLIPIHDHIVYL